MPWLALGKPLAVGPSAWPWHLVPLGLEVPHQGFPPCSPGAPGSGSRSHFPREGTSAAVCTFGPLLEAPVGSGLCLARCVALGVGRSVSSPSSPPEWFPPVDSALMERHETRVFTHVRTCVPSGLG